MRRNSRILLVSLTALVLVLMSFTATSEERVETDVALAQEVSSAPASPEALEVPVAEPKPAAPDLFGDVAVDCSPHIGIRIIREGEPVQSSNPNCICPHAGPGWFMTGDSCTVDPGGQTCSGECYWLDPIRDIGTGTPCGTS